ncbi:MAG: HAD family hydrolase [candidate division NC10 bacterium]|nr:HAD family hydrolase [candidate division NC10 bacterium]
MIQAVTFDLWQTLILETPEDLRRGRELRIEGMREILRERGYSVSTADIEEAYQMVGRRLETIWQNQVDIGPGEQVQLLLHSLDPELPLAFGEDTMRRLEEAYTSPVLKIMPVLNGGAADTLETLHERGVKLGLICNTGRTPGAMLRIVLERLGILMFFEALSFSNELRLRKPNPRIFIHTLGRLGVEPSRALHVGDDPQTDVTGAKGAGMRALWLRQGEDPPPAPEAVDGIIGSLPEVLKVLRRLEGG